MTNLDYFIKSIIINSYSEETDDWDYLEKILHHYKVVTAKRITLEKLIFEEFNVFNFKDNYRGDPEVELTGKELQRKKVLRHLLDMGLIDLSHAKITYPEDIRDCFNILIGVRCYCIAVEYLQYYYKDPQKNYSEIKEDKNLMDYLYKYKDTEPNFNLILNLLNA